MHIRITHRCSHGGHHSQVVGHILRLLKGEEGDEEAEAEDSEEGKMRRMGNGMGRAGRMEENGEMG